MCEKEGVSVSPSTLLNVYSTRNNSFFLYLFRSFAFIQFSCGNAFNFVCVHVCWVCDAVVHLVRNARVILFSYYFSARYSWLRCYWSCSSFATKRENCSVMQLGANWQWARKKSAKLIHTHTHFIYIIIYTMKNVYKVAKDNNATHIDNSYSENDLDIIWNNFFPPFYVSFYHVCSHCLFHSRIHIYEYVIGIVC